MTTTVMYQDHRTARFVLLGGISCCVLLATYSFLRYPTLLSPLIEGFVFLALFAFITIICSIAALRWTRTTTPSTTLALRLGIRWGVVIGLLWIIELIAGNILNPLQWWVNVAYFGATWTAFILPVVAGIMASMQCGEIKTGALVGFWSGLLSGLITFIALMLIIYLTMLTPNIPTPKDLQAWHQSGVSDFETFNVGDALAGAISHLSFIGPLLGTLAGAIGGVIGKQLNK